MEKSHKDAVAAKLQEGSFKTKQNNFSIIHLKKTIRFETFSKQQDLEIQQQRIIIITNRVRVGSPICEASFHPQQKKKKDRMFEK